MSEVAEGNDRWPVRLQLVGVQHEERGSRKAHHPGLGVGEPEDHHSLKPIWHALAGVPAGATEIPRILIAR